MKQWYRFIGVALGVYVGLVGWQFAYPEDTMPASLVEANNSATITRTEAVRLLEKRFEQKKIPIKVSHNGQAIAEPTLKKLGLKVDGKRVVDSWQYPWYWRLVPTSQWWIGAVTTVETPEIAITDTTRRYIEAVVMPVCRTAATNAALTLEQGELAVLQEVTGIICAQDNAMQAFERYTARQDAIVITSEATKASLTAADITAYLPVLRERIAGGVAVSVLDKKEQLTLEEVVPMVAFAKKDGNIAATIDTKRAIAFFKEKYSKVVGKQPGETVITTRDLTEVSRVTGQLGRSVDIPSTVATLEAVLAGNASEVQVRTKEIPAKVRFVRTYSSSDQAITALFKQYAEDTPGTFGISYAELDGKKRRAEYNGDKQFTTASTYKLFVAYSLLRSIERGERSWASEQACFDKMIRVSDNPCAEEDLKALGFGHITREAQAIGLGNTTFLEGDTPLTTANDLTALLASIEQRQALTGQSRERLLTAMRSNVYREGIPAGARGAVADKVGFLWDLKHDAAIVYSPSGTYVLTVMTDGAGWQAIAELTGKLEAIRER